MANAFFCSVDVVNKNVISTMLSEYGCTDCICLT
jgi:hypothetical protein